MNEMYELSSPICSCSDLSLVLPTEPVVVVFDQQLLQLDPQIPTAVQSAIRISVPRRYGRFLFQTWGRKQADAGQKQNI